MIDYHESLHFKSRTSMYLCTMIGAEQIEDGFLGTM